MPILTHYSVEVEVRTVVRDGVTGRLLVDVTSTGTSSGYSSDGLIEATAPALNEALNHRAPMLDAYRKADTDAAIAARPRNPR